MQAAQLYQKNQMLKRGMLVLIAVTLLGGSFFVHATNAQASSIFTATLSQSLLAKGYTVRSDNQTAVLGVPANGVSVPAKLTVKPADGTFPDISGLVRVSDVWTVDIVKLDSSVPATLQLTQPVSVGLLPWSHTLFCQRIYYFDRNAKQWYPLPSVRNGDDSMIYASMKLPYAQIAVFEDHDALEGVGSWFRHKLKDAAASNDFPMGSKLKVTDIDTKKTVTVTVRSRGPFVAGRIIDIAKTAFQQLRSTGEGVARLRVELET